LAPRRALGHGGHHENYFFTDAAIHRPLWQDRRCRGHDTSLVLLRLPDVMTLCGLSRSAIYEAMQRNAFPRPIKLNAGRACACIKSEVV
jgi:predicted DNA-binding transcriptional regulator AlpA